MSTNTIIILQSIAGFVLCWLALSSIYLLKYIFFLEVHEEHEYLIVRFGKVVKVFKEPGIFFFPERVLPWTNAINVSLIRDVRVYENVQVNDAKGTSLTIDLTVELKIKDPVKALFHVENWEDSLKGFIVHSSSSLLSSKTFEEIHHDRINMGLLLKQEIAEEAASWGIEVDMIFLRKIELLPEISHQMFHAISAKLEKAKAQVDERGRLRVSLLEAQTSQRVASLIADAKGQYPAAIGRAYEHLGSDPEVLNAYKELYRLSQIRPHRTTAFFGFKEGEVNPVDAFMIHQDADGIK